MTDSINPTEGRVYGGAENLIHLADGTRQAAGRIAAAGLENLMRGKAALSGARTRIEADEQPLCPGCYMVVVVAMAVELAQRNGQPLKELGDSLAAAFADIAANGVEGRNMEWIDVVKVQRAVIEDPRVTEAEAMRVWPGVMAPGVNW